LTPSFTERKAVFMPSKSTTDRGNLSEVPGWISVAISNANCNGFCGRTSYENFNHQKLHSKLMRVDEIWLQNTYYMLALKYTQKWAAELKRNMKFKTVTKCLCKETWPPSYPLYY
jgi:hypothetical protein